MQRPQVEFPLDFFPHLKVKLKRDQASNQLGRVPAECCSGGGCHGVTCVGWESALWGRKVVSSCGIVARSERKT